MRTTTRWLPAVLMLTVALPFQPRAVAQEPPTGGEDLGQLEARLSERYDRLELLVARLAELSGSTQPRRATLLRQLVAQSRDQDVAGQFDKVIASLEKRSYSSAIDGQAALEADLQKLLELLLQEDRDRQLESERKRISRYLQDVNKLIRLQRGVQGRTDGGDDAKELAEDQQRVGDQTEKLGEEIAESEETAEERARREQAEGEQGEDEQAEGEQSGEPKAGESESGKGQSKSGGSEGEKPEGEKTPSESQGQQNQGQQNQGQQGQQGQPSEGQPSQGQPSEGSPSQGQSSQQQGQQSEQQDAGTPMERTAQRLKQAQQRMAEAKKQLDQAKRDGAVKQQQEAVQQLEQAKAELERILRQLREEELERMLVMLEARIRKMLEAQVEIYDETKQLDGAVDKAAEHELEIASARLARQENLIVREADRALVLLREDGTSVAFPEAISQAREDMQTIADRLRDAKVDAMTQGLEEDVIATLEESLAAMQQALKDLRDQKGQPAQPGGGAPGEMPLVQELEELRMIRALQARINNRTRRYGAMIDGETALVDDIIQALRELSIRQQKIFEATQELSKEGR